MNKKTILVVDDNPANLKLACNVLEFEGFQVRKAVDAEDASEMIRRLPPDLILMDLGLPGMDGLALTRMLKANETTADIVIVALTAFAMKGDEQKARDAGCDGYITKPIDTRTLGCSLQPFLSRKPGGHTGLASAGGRASET